MLLRDPRDLELLKAVLKKPVDIDEIDRLINVEKANPYYTDENGRNYLHLSVFLRSLRLIDYWLYDLPKHIDKDAGDKDQVTALHRACRYGSDEIVDYLIQMYDADANKEAADSIYPLHVAAAFGHTKCVEKLGSIHYVKLDCRDSKHHTPLHYAASEGHNQVVSVLIRLGCDVDAENIAGNRPIHFAAALETPEICSLLIKQSADIDAQNFNGQTALHIATLQACPEIVFYLLNAGADPNVKDSNGNTCSHLAIKNGHIEILKILMNDSRTDTSISDNDQNTVLHVALKLGHYNLIEMMLPRARDLTRQDADGNSVIIEAIKNQLEDSALDMLKACPLLVHTTTIDLVTPLHLAAERGMKQLTKQLLIAGAQVDATDSSGLTPSLYCAKNDSVLECLAMIEDIMMIPDNDIDDNKTEQHVKGGNSNKISSRISS